MQNGIACETKTQRAVYDAATRHATSGPTWTGETRLQPLRLALANRSTRVDVFTGRQSRGRACKHAGAVITSPRARAGIVQPIFVDDCTALRDVAGSHLGAAFLRAVENTYGGACQCARSALPNKPLSSLLPKTPHRFVHS